ncbi:hypothetical protein [Draconibacterium sediminis]|nr:hypothetical protein [Draconibacterium sediminis]
MKYIIKSIFIILLLQGCSTDSDRIERNHELLNIILKDRLTLESKTFIIKETNDTISIGKIIMIANSYNNLEFDTLNNRFGVFTYLTVPLNHPFYKDSEEYIFNQIQHLPATNWDTSRIQMDIDIENPQLEQADKNTDEIMFWIATHQTKNYLVISEPIENKSGDVTVSAKLFMGKYNIDKSYFMTKENNQWTITESGTAISKNISKIYDDRTEVAEIMVGYYDI